MAGQQPSFPSEFPAAQQQAMINQFGGNQMVPELMGPQQVNMSSNLVNPQQFGAGMSGNYGVAGSNPMAQQLMTQQRQQLAQQTLMQQQLQQQQEQQHTALVPQSNQAVTQVQAPREPAPQVQTQSQQRTPKHPRQPQPQQPKEHISTISLCKIGQRIIHDITLVTLDLFNNLRTVQPPDGTQQGHAKASERKNQIIASLDQHIPKLFNYLRNVYDIFNEHCQLQGMEYTHIKSLIPLKGESDMKFDEKKTSEVYRHACEERNKLIEQLTAKNRYLKEIIDHMRLIISEISVMLHMRRT